MSRILPEPMEQIVPDVLDPPGTRKLLRRLYQLSDGGDPDKIRRLSAGQIYSPKELREILNPRTLDVPAYVVLRPLVSFMILYQQETKQSLSFADRIRLNSSRGPKK